MSIAKPKLPDGWTSDAIDEWHTVLKSPTIGYVTICWGQGQRYATRGFRSGWSRSGRLVSDGRYEGRGWRERLVADAVKWLRDIGVAR